MPDPTINRERIMFSFWDGGRGHLSRCLAIATEAVRRDIEVGFIVSEKYAQEVGRLALSSNIHVIPNRPPSPSSPPYEFPLYSHAFRHAQRLKGLGFDNIEWLTTTTQREIKAIHAFRPSIIINDYRDTIRSAAEACDVPVVGITQTTGNIDGYSLGSWIDVPPDTQLPDCMESFNTVRTKLGLEPISDERYMFSGDINVIPSIPALDPLREQTAPSYYVGMISQYTPKNEEFSHLQGFGEKIFSYVGEPTRPAYGYEEMLTRVIQSQPELGFYVVGDPAKYNNGLLYPRIREGVLKIAPFISGPEGIQDSSLVLSHGGHSTSALSLSKGKPIIGVGPYQSEAATTLRNIEKVEAGIFLPHSYEPLERRVAPDLGEKVEMFGYWKSELTADQISEAILAVLEDEKYTHNARKLGDELLALGGVRRVIDLCQQNY